MAIWFLLIFVWAPLSSKNTCRGSSSPAPADQSHHHHLVVVFWPPQWSTSHQVGFFQPSSYQAPCFDLLFDLEIPGPHLNWSQKVVPISVKSQVWKSLFWAYLLNLWTPLAFSRLFMFLKLKWTWINQSGSHFKPFKLISFIGQTKSTVWLFVS